MLMKVNGMIMEVREEALWEGVVGKCKNLKEYAID